MRQQGAARRLVATASWLDGRAVGDGIRSRAEQALIIAQRLAATGLPLPFASVRNRRSLIGIRTLVEALDRLCTGRWPPDKSGNYCLADAESLSLPAIVTELRRGMGLPPRLFPCPPGVLKVLAAAANRQQMAAGLLGDLRVDAGRFQATFDFTPTQDLAASIAQSGMCYRRPASAGPSGNVE